MMALDILSWIFLILGSVFSIIGGIGIVRLPEFFSRLHGGGITDTMGAGLIVVGLMFQSDGPLVGVKLAFILIFMMVTSPTACHALAKSALTRGIKPELDDGKKPA
jgi:multicomponent Na+:H+ antiporter subunit G